MFYLISDHNICISIALVKPKLNNKGKARPVYFYRAIQAQGSLHKETEGIHFHVTRILVWSNLWLLWPDQQYHSHYSSVHWLHRELFLMFIAVSINCDCAMVWVLHDGQMKLYYNHNIILGEFSMKLCSRFDRQNTDIHKYTAGKFSYTFKLVTHFTCSFPTKCWNYLIYSVSHKAIKMSLSLLIMHFQSVF